MKTKEKINNTTAAPEEFFQGKDLVMAQAIYKDDVGEIERLITQESYDPNTRGNVTLRGRTQQFTYLNYAVLIKNINSAEKLLELKADVNLVALDGGGQLGNMNIACGGKSRPLIDLLLKYKVNLNNPISASPINPLLMGNDDRVLIDLLINNGANINHQNYIDGSTPLFTALSIGKFNYVDYFLDHNADPLILDSSGNSVAYLVQKELEDGRLSDSGSKEYRKLYNRFKNEFNVQFPLKRNYKLAFENSIERYQNLNDNDKKLLGNSEFTRIEKYRKSIRNGVDLAGRPLK